MSPHEARSFERGSQIGGLHWPAVHRVDEEAGLCTALHLGCKRGSHGDAQAFGLIGSEAVAVC
jgi:hypothetical protein